MGQPHAAKGRIQHSSFKVSRVREEQGSSITVVILHPHIHKDFSESSFEWSLQATDQATQVAHSLFMIFQMVIKRKDTGYHSTNGHIFFSLCKLCCFSKRFKDKFFNLIPLSSCEYCLFVSPIFKNFTQFEVVTVEHWLQLSLQSGIPVRNDRGRDSTLAKILLKFLLESGACVE